MTHRYIGTKIVTAWQQDKVTEVDPGHPTFAKKVERGYAVKYEDGYVSWSPIAAFAAAYRLAEGTIQCLTFGDALHFLKLGHTASRAGWNGSNQYVFLVNADQWTYTNGKNDNMPLRSFLALRATDGTVVPWAPSGSDALAEDWSVL